MSRPKRDNRDFKLADDDNSTNDFINSVAKNAPRKKAEESSPVVDRPSNNEPWTSDVYTRLNGAGDSRRTQGHNCFSILVLGFSVLLLLAGAALIVVAAIEKDQKLLPICPACDKVMIGMYAVGGFVIFVGIVGIVASRTRTKALAVPYCMMLGILALAFTGLTVLVIVFITNTNGLHLNSAWETEVKDDPDSICELQTSWQCSGFNTCCNGVVTNETTATTATVTMTTNLTDTTTLADATTTTVATTADAPSLNRVAFHVAADNDTTTTTVPTETPSTATPTDVPTTVTDAPTTEIPSPTDAPTTATDAPTTEVPTTAAPTDAPTTVTDTPTTETPSTAVPTDAPTSEAPTTTTTEAFTTTTAETTTSTTEAPTTTVDPNVTTTTTTTTTTVLANTTTEAPSYGNCFSSSNGEWPQTVKDQCVVGCSSNVYQSTCDDVLHNKLKDNLGYVLAVLIPATFIIIVMAFFSIRMTRVTRYLE